MDMRQTLSTYGKMATKTINSQFSDTEHSINYKCGPMPNVMAALPNINGAVFDAGKFG